MTESILLPSSPENVPDDLTHATSSYKRHIWLAVTGLISFLLFYLALTTCFAYISYYNFLALQNGNADIFHIVTLVISSVLTIFMVKAFFVIRKSTEPKGIEVNAEEEPALFDFLHSLADEIGAPKPHKVFITPEVNAAVFYDLSLINLFFPSKKNLIIGLGLVNVLNLGELKAVLAHEFGHFAQSSMAVGRWVYIAQQIISHMVATRDWLDSIVKFISRIDIRIAWLGWLLALIIWSIRSIMDTLFQLVILAERALSREMEFNADLVAVSVTGSDALVHALHKLQAADNAWQTTLDVAQTQAEKNKMINDLFSTQQEVVTSIGKVLNDKNYGVVPTPESGEMSEHRVFSEDMARPPQMWSTHPANRDREDNAKKTYVAAEIDERSSWLVFSNPEMLRKKISQSFYNKDKINELEEIFAEEAVEQSFNKASFSSQYRGTYLNRSIVRNFSSYEEILKASDITTIDQDSVSMLYTETVAEKLKLARSLDLERYALEALASGELKPSGGVIRHRGKELKKSEIPEALEEISTERKEIGMELKNHDANCRKTHLLIANRIGKGWDEYLESLTKLLHCTEHQRAIVDNEQALLVNTWQVITADGQIGYFEKRRILKVCNQVQEKIRKVSDEVNKITLPDTIAQSTNIENWQNQYPKFEIADVSKKNWPEWCEAASKIMNNLSYALGLVQAATLEELIITEEKLNKHLNNETTLEEAPSCGACPQDYEVLLLGDEHVLQRKLDLWNRFQLAHGFMPTTLRLLVSLGIVGGTLYSGLISF